jgi:hypothetical protein
VTGAQPPCVDLLPVSTGTETENATKHSRKRGKISEAGVECYRGYRLIRRAQIDGDMPQPRPEQVLILMLAVARQTA